MQYNQDIHYLYLSIKGSGLPAHLCSMTRTVTVYIWALKALNCQRLCAEWPGHSLCISGHWRLRTASASVRYDQGIRCLYLGIEDSNQPALLCSMIRTFTISIWALKTQNNQRFCVVWPGHSLSIPGHWRLRTASASVQYDQDIHCLFLGTEDSEQPALVCGMTRAFTVYI